MKRKENRFAFVTVALIATAFLLTYPTTASASQANDTLALDLQTVMQTALEKNHQLKALRMNPLTAREQIQLAQSAFDPQVSVTGSTADQESWDEPDDSSTLQVATEASVAKKMETGTSFSATLTAAEMDSETDTLGDVGGSYLRSTAAVSHPLMKNNGRQVNLRSVTLATHQFRKSEFQLKQAVMDTIAQAQNLYWAYYSALESLTVYEKSLELAQRFIREVDEKVKMGSAARLDLLQARSEVASREAEIITGQNRVDNAADTLLNYIYGEARPGVNVSCQTLPAIPEMTNTLSDEKQLIHQALALRTDHQTAGIDIESADVDLLYYENQTKPDLTLDAAVGINDGHPDNDAFVSDDLENYYYGSVGITLKFPWGFRGEKANLATAKLSKRQLMINQDAVRSQIVLDVRTALRDLKAAVKRYETAQTASNYAEESLEAEQIKFRNGLSTSYNVLLYQRDLTDARVREVDALIACQTALIALHQAVGNTLEVNNIELAWLEEPR